jgi:hypothetical protein
MKYTQNYLIEKLPYIRCEDLEELKKCEDKLNKMSFTTDSEYNEDYELIISVYNDYTYTTLKSDGQENENEITGFDFLNDIL